MKTLQLCLLALLITLTSCRKAPDYLTSQEENENHTPVPTGETLIIRSGTSFGMCMGYCITEIEVRGTTATFTEKSPRDPAQYPERSSHRTLSSSERNCLLSALDWSAFSNLETVIGCPDCADGGAEWIEIVRGDQVYRVTFEYGASIPEIQPLLDRIRTLRATFKGGEYIYGTWEWIESSGGLAGVTVTPASAGYTQRTIYRSDGTATLLRDGSPVTSTTYIITREKTFLSNSEEDVIHYADDSVQPQMMRLRGDTLYLTDLCLDCFEHTYVRASTICE